MKRPLHAALFLSSVAAAGCTLLLDTSRTQCETDADCVARGGTGLVCRAEACVVGSAASADAASDAPPVAEGPWGCLANPPSRVVEDRSQVVSLRRRYVVYSLNDCEHNRPIPGATLKLCSQRDVTCGSPVETSVTDCEGYATFKAAYRGFEGFYLIEPPRPNQGDAGGDWPATTRACFDQMRAKEVAEGRTGERCALRTDGSGKVVIPMPDDMNAGLEQIIPPPANSDDVSTEIPVGRAPVLLSTNTLRTLLGAIGKPFDAKAGHLVTLSLDCERKTAAGVTLAVSGGIGLDSQNYYTDDQGLPNVNQGETVARGEAGYLNLDPGQSGINAISVTATRRATNERIGVYGALIRSGYITYMEMSPLRSN